MEHPKPKKPCSAYIFFVTEKSAQIREEKNLSYAEAFKSCGPLWNGLSDTEKEKYNKMAQADQER